MSLTDPLRKKNPQKAIEYVVDIIVNDKGDDYLQGTLWSFYFTAHKEDLLGALRKRKESIGKALLADIINSLTIFVDSADKDLIVRIQHDYALISSEDRTRMLCDYTAFNEKFSI